MTDEREMEQPSGRRATVNANPVAALRREELKYAHLRRRDSEIRSMNREALSEHIAEIQDAVQPVPRSTGPHLDIADRYRSKRPDTGSDER